jgi:hypothetical protein
LAPNCCNILPTSLPAYPLIYPQHHSSNNLF